MFRVMGNQLTFGKAQSWRLACLALLLCVTQTALADARDQAKRIHDRIAGVPPTDSVLQLMQADIEGGDPQAAAYRAMNNPNFYNVTLKNLVTPWTNEEQNAFAPLNDYTATVIGMVRDGVGFDNLLSANILYHANGTNIANPIPGDPATAPNYSRFNNDHYVWLENNGVDLAANLVRDSQSNWNGLPGNATAGIMTTRAAAEAFFIAGTNRAMFRFTLLNHMCVDLEQVKDTTRSPDRIRQDVSRSPGGDSRIFLNNCVGCHAGMDPLAQAFAYYEFNETTGAMEYSRNQVQGKYFINGETFAPGYVTPDDSWENFWREGQNALLGWDSGSGKGKGAKSMGRELAGTQAFAACQVKKVFKAVCLRDPVDSDDRGYIDTWTSQFRGPFSGPTEMGGYQLKPVFAEAAAYCRGS